MPRFFAITLDDFQRMFDDAFDDLLIERWRLGKAAAEFEHAIVRDDGDRYQVSIPLRGADPAGVQVEVSERRLTVRIADETSGERGGVFSLSEPVDPNAVEAKAGKGTLLIVLPKRPRMRRVRIEQT
jgi:HSP20 family molecular chaperone IbpA